MLQRKLGLFPVTNIVIANMVGAGIFTTSGLLMADLGNSLLMLALWVLGGVIALCGALSYGQLGAAMPQAGGEYYFLSRLYHPLFGFLSGWVSFVVGFSAPIAASAIGCSEYLARAAPDIFLLNGAATTASALIVKKAAAILIILAFTSLHYRGMQLGARVQNVLTILKVGLILFLVFSGFIFGKGDIGHLSSGIHTELSFAGWKSMGLSLLWIMFAYSGWNAATYIGAEVKDPRKNMPLSLVAGTLVVIVLYILLNAFYIYAIPPDDMKEIISIGGLAAGRAFGGVAESVLSLLIAFALFSSLSAFIILGPRVYYAMAKDGHFFSFVASVHPRFNVPHKAIILQAIIAVIMVLSGSFDQILTFMGFSLGIFPILAVLGVFKLRRNSPSSFRYWGDRIVPWVYVLFSVVMLTLAYLERPVESTIAILTVLVGVPLYFYFNSFTPKSLQSSSSISI
jgi:APA family basic amino acid/polyamine antiporter